jgi:hypothetical protein
MKLLFVYYITSCEFHTWSPTLSEHRWRVSENIMVGVLRKRKRSDKGMAKVKK